MFCYVKKACWLHKKGGNVRGKHTNNIKKKKKGKKQPRQKKKKENSSARFPRYHVQGKRKVRYVAGRQKPWSPGGRTRREKKKTEKKAPGEGADIRFGRT